MKINQGYLIKTLLLWSKLLPKSWEDWLFEKCWEWQNHLERPKDKRISNWRVRTYPDWRMHHVMLRDANLLEIWQEDTWAVGPFRVYRTQETTRNVEYG